MQVELFDFSGFKHLFFSLQDFGFLNQFIPLCFQLIYDSLVISYLSQQLSILRFFVEISGNQSLGIRYSLYDKINTVEVLMVLNACSTVENFFISDYILFLNILLTKI